MARYQELIKAFDYYRLSYENESVLLLEVILMHLHMSMEEVQHFCGLEGIEDLSAVHSSMQEWASSKTARSAVWHAGQVVRALKLLPALHLRDFHAISLFHASLAFWAFGLAERTFALDQGSSKQTASAVTGLRHAIYLDDEETSASYRYITMGRGKAAIRKSEGEPPVVLLSDLKGTMTAVMELMAHGDSEPTMPNSPLVETLLHVMLHIRDTLAPVDNFPL
jgi:hypothetical protein